MSASTALSPGRNADIQMQRIACILAQLLSFDADGNPSDEIVSAHGSSFVEGCLTELGFTSNDFYALATAPGPARCEGLPRAHRCARLR